MDAIRDTRPAPPPGACAGWAAALGALLLVAGCDNFNRWDGLVYKNRFDRSDVIELGTFATLDECREAALRRMRALKIGELGDYICGENCMVQVGFNPTRMCRRTAR